MLGEIFDVLSLGLSLALGAFLGSPAVPGDEAAPAETALGSAPLCMVTLYTDQIAQYAELAVANQRAYADLHGYTYRVYRGRLSGARFRDPGGHVDPVYSEGLYWQKIAAMQAMLAAQREGRGGPLCRWVVWVDADVVITRPERRLEDVLALWSHPDPARRLGDAPAALASLQQVYGAHCKAGAAAKEVVLAREEVGKSRRDINAGVVFVANSRFGRSFLAAVAAAYPHYKGRVLPEQDAIRDFIWQNPLTAPPRESDRDDQLCLHPRVGLAPQRAFNAFARWQQPDPPTAQWQPCDFVAHISGTPRPLRRPLMEDVLRRAQTCGGGP